MKQKEPRLPKHILSLSRFLYSYFFNYNPSRISYFAFKFSFLPSSSVLQVSLLIRFSINTQKQYTNTIPSFFFHSTFVMQNFCFQPSAFLARFSVNFCDKSIAIFSKYGLYVSTEKISGRAGR